MGLSQGLWLDLSSFRFVVELSKIRFLFREYYTPKGGYKLTVTLGTRMSPNKILFIWGCTFGYTVVGLQTS